MNVNYQSGFSVHLPLEDFDRPSYVYLFVMFVVVHLYVMI